MARRAVELLASYSNTAPQVSELYGRILDSMPASDDDGTPA